MKPLYQPKLETKPKKEDLDLIGQGIEENNVLVTGQSTGNKEIALFVRDPEHKIIGGVRGFYNSSGWLYVNGLWVAKEYRSKGYGTLLMQSIEAEARTNGCTKSHLYTMEHQAPEFYKKLGYVIFARLERFHQDYDKCFFKKDLQQA
jgi:GNAT superfamily N-acetyltransferase